MATGRAQGTAPIKNAVQVKCATCGSFPSQPVIVGTDGMVLLLKRCVMQNPWHNNLVLFENIAMRSSPGKSYYVSINFINQQPIRFNVTIPKPLKITF